MRTELLLIIAAFVVALRRQPAQPVTPAAIRQEKTADDLRYQVAYRQQFIAVQAAQTSTVDAKYAVLLTLVALLFQYVDGPIENGWAHWFVFGAYCFVATVLLGLIAMQRVEVSSSEDSLLQASPATLDATTLQQTHALLGQMMRDNEARLGAKEYWMRWVLVVGLAATIVGLVFDTKQAPVPMPVIVVSPTRTSSPPSPHATGVRPLEQFHRSVVSSPKRGTK